MEPWKQELYHHGILGQKWGKRMGPPYPLAADKHSSAERKANWQNSLDNGPSQFKSRKKIVSNSNSTLKKRNKVDSSSKFGNGGAFDSNNKAIPLGGGGGIDKELTEEQKKILQDLYAALAEHGKLISANEIDMISSQDFGLTLAEQIGIDADKIPKEELEAMRKAAIKHYSKSQSEYDKHESIYKKNEEELEKEKRAKEIAEKSKKASDHYKKMIEEENKKKISHSLQKPFVNELYHHGILGQKWGKRNGPPYPLSRGKEIKENKKKRTSKNGVKEYAKKLNTKSIKTKTENISPATATLREAGNITRSAYNIADITKKKKRHVDSSRMSDAELRAAINRLNMEKQYSDLMNERSNINNGREKLLDILEVSGEVLAIGTSAAIITSMIYGMKNK